MSQEQVLVRYRLERATEAIAEARLLIEAGHLHSSVNRLYYACFYAMSALLLAQGLMSSKHPSIQRAVLHREFIRPGRIPSEFGPFVDLLSNNRQMGDYSDLAVFQADQVKGWLQQTSRFVECVSRLAAV